MAENWIERAARMRARVLTMTDDELREAIDLALEAAHEQRLRDERRKHKFEDTMKEAAKAVARCAAGLV